MDDQSWRVEQTQVTAILKEPLGKCDQPTLAPGSTGFEAYRDLFVAVEAGQLDRVQLALNQGADPNRKNWSGQSIIHEAIEHGQTMVVDLLLKYGANPNLRGTENRTPLHLACFKGHFMIASALINSGADLNAQDKVGNTPLHEAAAKGRAGLVSLLLSQGNRVNPRIKNNKKQEPKDLCPGGDSLKLLTGEISDPVLYSGETFASLDDWDGQSSNCSEDSSEELSDDGQSSSWTEGSSEELSDDGSSGEDAMDIQ